MSRLSKLLAAMLALALVAAACGSSGDSTDSTGGGGDTDTSTDVSTGDQTGQDATNDEAGDPVRGGKLVYGIEADSANPWVHYATSCAISCRMIFRAISDPLFMTDTDGTIQPYLVDTLEASADYKTWTLTVKEGISFHDGTPLDGEAVKYNVDACRKSPLTGPSFLGLADVQASGQTVTFTYANPDALGPNLLREEVCGYMFSPTWMKTLKNNPLLTEAEKAAATGDPAAPVGLGPFKFQSYTPGNGNAFVAVRNDDYWRGDGPNSVTKEGLPYLDEVQFVVAVDIQGRSNGLKSGEFDIIHTANADEVSKYEGDDAFTLIKADAYGETSYILLNVGAGENPTLAAVRGVPNLPMDPGGLNAKSPINILSCRKALAAAIDVQRVADERQAGLVRPANGPFPPGSMGYLEDSGYPAFDPDAAQAEWENCKTEAGTDTIEFAFNTTNDAFNVETNTLVASMWTDAFGDEVKATIAPIEQGQYIGLALAGTFQAQGWRNHAGVDPTEQWYWWNSATASPIDPQKPELALNFGRFQDPDMDKAYATIRTNPDEAARKAAAETVNQQFGKNVWNFWLYWTLWGVIANPNVQNITDLTFPGSDATTMPVIAGKHNLAQVWCTGPSVFDTTRGYEMVRKLTERPSRIVVPLLILIVLWGFVAGPRIRWIFAALLIVGTGAAFLTNGRYAVRRIMGIVPIMLAVSFLVFGLMASLPGDPAINILGPSATPDAVEQVRNELGLDQPFFNRYGDWLGDLVMGDLGTSVQRRQPVADGIGQSITPSLQLMAYSVILASLLAFPLGVYAAYKQGRRPDRVINTVMLGFFAVPNFVIAVNLVLFLAIGGLSVFGTRLGLKILPGAGYVEFGEDPVEHFKRMLLPSLSLALGQSAVFMRLLRSDMIGTLRLPFIDLARSKGLSTNRILWRHALRPSMFTLLTVMGFSVGALIGGAIITEVIFTMPGIGSFMLESITRRDYISVQGGTLVIATLYILTLVMVDFLYLALDPRLRTTGGGLGGGNG